jgi:hypothetical protein
MAAATKAGAKRQNKSYRSPRLGERRKHRKPLRIDKLSPEVKEAIISARASGLTWKETASAASGKAGLHLSASTVQRWHDLRIEQPANEIATTNKSLGEIIRILKSILSAVQANQVGAA